MGGRGIRGEVASALVFKSLCLLFPKMPFYSQNFPFIFQKCPFCFPGSALLFSRSEFCFSEMSYGFPELPISFPELPSSYLLCASFSSNGFFPADCTFYLTCSELLREIIFTYLLFPLGIIY